MLVPEVSPFVRGNLFDIVLLPVLIVFFGFLQAQRPLRQYRLWLSGWLLVLMSFVVWVWPVESPGRALLLECIRIDFLICGGAVFMASSVPQGLSLRRLVVSMSAVCLFLCLLANLTVADMGAPLLLAVLICLAEGMGIWMAGALLGDSTSAVAIRLECMAAAIILLVSLATHHQDLLITVVLIQLFGGAAILTVTTRTKGVDTGAWMTAAGFLAWAAIYIAEEPSLHSPVVSDFLQRIWNAPKVLVALGMVATVLESDATQIQSLSEEYRLLYESNPHPMWIFDPASARFLSVNDAAVHAYGYSREEFLAMTLYDLRPESDGPRAKDGLRVPGESGKQVWRHQRKDATIFEVDVSGHEVMFRGQKAQFVMAIDITERERMNRELVYRAQHDVLTGLANRMLLEDRAQITLARCSRDGSKAALLTIDVDRFKQINDMYGHPVGDECLKAIAVRLRTRVRDADTLARTGGEEFMVMIGGLASIHGAQAAANAFLGSLDKPLTLSVNAIKVSASIGVAVYPDDGEDLDTLRRRSDRALYRAKKLGGNRALLDAEEDIQAGQSATDIESALREALVLGTMELAYQPIFHSSGEMVRVEALVRGTEECLRKSGPASFIQVAEESGLIIPLGSWVLEEGCRQMAQWRAQGLPEFHLAVNVSARQLVQEDFAEQVLHTLERHNLPPASLHLELTETTLMRDFNAVVRSMNRLAAVGVLFSIDDFGTGYSSLARLSDLPISTIKIDRSFILKLTDSEAATGIVRAIVYMGRHLKLEVVAEGVDRPEHIDALRSLGCHLYQGFYLSRPLTPGGLADELGHGELGAAVFAEAAGRLM
jgi:diguanylate cyclase (GGDEF)-like protein/PAS domain S-box-containing protein